MGDATFQQAMQGLSNAESEIMALKTALSECWTLCNTLASLSSIHRQRVFNHSARTDVQEQAWRTCWRLCQQLYDTRDEEGSEPTQTLELCRHFCQALFDARHRGDEAADSVLRVSFELNKHLYNTHDRNLPEEFRERTLVFYIALCHRLMKQRTSLPQETDALLRACWQLAEMLFNLRQATRESRAPDEELLGSAVQACWDLCDLFREGWTQIRPERGTPRPSQTTFSSQPSTAQPSQSDGRSSSMSNSSYHDAPSLPPETPTTIFDDTTAASSPDSVNIPNILVLGPASSSGSTRAAHHDRWSSNASTLSDYSESSSSQRTSSTATTTTGSQNAHLTRLRALILKAAMNTGFSRPASQSQSQSQSQTQPQPLPAYVNALPPSAFGAQPWQMEVLTHYKKLVLADQSLKASGSVPSRRLSATEVAKAVKWLGRDDRWAWMRDLYRLVFGFGVEEAERRGGGIQV